MHFGVPFLFVASRKFTTTHIAREWLLARVSPDVRGQMVRPGERSHAYAALERFLARVYAYVSGEFI